MNGAELRGLATTELGRRTVHLEEVDSTNRWLKESGDALPHGTVCYTGCQTRGRGRLGRTWKVPPGASLAMSVLLRQAEMDWSGLPLVSGIAVARALNRLAGDKFGVSFRIKWPNDIICGSRKVCGILCESSQGEQGRFAVVGIGVNLNQTEEDFQREELPCAASIKSLIGTAPSYGETAAAILNELEIVWGIYVRQGFLPLLAPYETLCATVGREVRLLSPGGDPLAAGRAMGVAEDGGLIVDTAEGRRIFHSGEVSVRGLYDYI